MAPSYGSLVKEAIVLLDEFTAGTQCLDDFLEDISKDLQMETAHRNFILDVVSGCIEHKKLLDVVINSFCGLNWKWLSKNDRSHFVVICYLTTFALDDIGLQVFGNVVRSLDVKKIHTFLSFFFTNLTTWIQEEWNSIYDAAFVQEHLIGPLLRWRPQIDMLMDELAVKSDQSQLKKASIKTTKPQEFALTKPKPQALPMPELIPQQEKHKPAPKSTHRAPKEMQRRIEEIKLRNRQKTEELLYEANRKQFRCANPQKSERTKNVMSQIREDLDSKLKFSSFHSSGSPSGSKSNSWPIKLNSAAILRQGALYDRQVQEELQRMERLVEGAREPSSFLQWQKETRKKDLQEKLAQIERRRLEGRISYEEAAMARARIMERNQKTAQLKKEETAQLMQKYAEKRLQEEKELRDLVQQVSEGHKNSKTAKEKLQKFKQNIVKEVSEQSRELLSKALEEAQADLSRKFEIIREIHAVESLPPIRVKTFDDTETAGHTLLGEMSLAELRERLSLLREARQRELQEKRELIMEEKQNKKQLLLEQLDTISLQQRMLAQTGAIRKEERKAEPAVSPDETVLALQRKLEEKQQERQRLKQTESNKAKVCELTAAQTDRLTEESWKDLELKLERHIQNNPPSATSHPQDINTSKILRRPMKI